MGPSFQPERNADARLGDQPKPGASNRTEWVTPDERFGY
jgi:hypothetical protein